MTLTLEITPEIETRLRADAARANVPLEALAFERLTGDGSHSAAARLWARLTNPQTHNAAILEIAQAPAQVRAIINAKSGAAAAAFYATPEGAAELADWRALDGEPFQDDAGDYYSEAEEAAFRAEREVSRGAEGKSQ